MDRSLRFKEPVAYNHLGHYEQYHKGQKNIGMENSVIPLEESIPYLGSLIIDFCMVRSISIT